MKRVLLTAVLLAQSCGDAEPRLDASSKATLQASLEVMLQSSPQSVKRAASEAIAAIVQRELTRTQDPDPGLAILKLNGLTLGELLQAGREAKK